MIVMKELIILNPDYHLMNDKRRTLLFTKGTIKNESDRGSFFIHPVQAMILSFFTFDRDLDENVKLLSAFLNQSEDAVLNMISPFIENEEPLKSVWEGHTILFPRSVLINADINKNNQRKQVCLTDLRCKEKIDLSTERNLTSPSEFTFMLTNKCVTNCIYCYADKTSSITNQLTTTRILDIIKEASLLNVSRVNLIGGEIFLHKDWHIILSELVKYDIPPITLSTKIPITEDIAKKIRASGYSHHVQISLDTSDVTILQELLKVKSDYLEKIIEGMYWLDKYEIPFHVATILTKLNADEEQMLELSKLLSKFACLKVWDVRVAINSLHIDVKRFTAIKADLKSLKRVYGYVKEQIVPNVKYKVQYSNELLDRNFCNYKAGESFGLICSALRFQMFVLPDGKVTICEQLYWDSRFIIGDLTSSSIEEVWNSPEAMLLINLKSEKIQDASSCKRCDFQEKCYGSCRRCWIDVQRAYGKSNWDYPDPRCELAPEMNTNVGYV